MYSVLLAAAITTGTTAPAWGIGHGCNGSCYGWSGHNWGCHGCGSCHGWGSGYGCTGCYGSAYHVIPVARRGYAWGGCHGISFGSCMGCQGSCWGCWGSGYGNNWESNPWGASPPVIEEKPAPKPEEKKKTEAGKDSKNAIASITVNMPENARLTVDGQEYPRLPTIKIITPSLEPGREYFYTLRIEQTKNGEAVQESRRVVFESGADLKVDFRMPEKNLTAQK